MEKTKGEVVEQVIRPTGLVDPEIHVKPAKGQVQDLIKEIEERTKVKERTLVTVLTKRMAEDLTTYFRDGGVRCKWLHSELDAIERITVLRELREGTFDVLVGVNLLREGLDLPEVSLVAILDADKEGFLRSDKSLIQTMGRAARNVNAEVILYADRVTDSMQRAMTETARRREVQLAHNAKYNIVPKTVVAGQGSSIEDEVTPEDLVTTVAGITDHDYVTEQYLEDLQREMLEAAEKLDFERAAQLRDLIAKQRGEKVATPQQTGKKGKKGKASG